MRPALVLLAAGLGRRFGGAKQLAAVGPHGEALIDFTLRDAAAAGFGESVLIIGHHVEALLDAHLARFPPPGPSPLLVFQDELEPRRDVPWGTAHALLACREIVDRPFAVANADDHYGAGSLNLLADLLRAPEFGPGRAALVGFELARTLSPEGGVTRAVCRVDDQGRLTDIAEHRSVCREGATIVSDLSDDLDPRALVSMNLWGFHQSIFGEIAPRFEAFAARHTEDEAELLLPDLVGDLLVEGRLEVTVVRTGEPWYGITYPADTARVRQALSGR